MTTKLPVLVIDDEADARETLCMVLERGFATSQAAGAQQALDLLKGKPFSVVFLDIILPGMSGKIVLKNIKSAWPYTEVIMVTGLGEPETAFECLEAGAYDYLTKPWEIPQLMAAANRAAEKWSLKVLLGSREGDFAGFGRPSARSLAAEYLRAHGDAYPPAYQAQIKKSARALGLEPYHQIVEHLERTLILNALKACDNNRAHAARILGLHRNSLSFKLKALKIKIPK